MLNGIKVFIGMFVLMPHEPLQDFSHQSNTRELASSQAVCHSFIVALLGMVIGSQSTSNRLIGFRPGRSSGPALCARVFSFVRGVGSYPVCMLLSLSNSTSVSLNLLSLLSSCFSLFFITYTILCYFHRLNFNLFCYFCSFRP